MPIIPEKTTEQTDASTGGYWTEGKVIQTPNGPLNIGGGVFVPGKPAVGSTLSNLTNVPNLPPNVPSSSASSVVSSNALGAVSGTTQAPTPTFSESAQSANSLARAYSSQGVNITSDQIQSWIDAGYDPKEAAAQAAQYWQTNEQRRQRLQEQQMSYNADLAKNNAEYAAASAKLQAARDKAVHTGVAQAAKAGVFEDQSSDAVSFGNAINRTYDQLQIQLDQAAQAANAAAQSGNYKAVAEINSAMDQMLQSGLANIAQRQQTEQAQREAKRQYEQTYTRTLQNQAQDNLMNLVSTFSASPELQSDLTTYQQSDGKTVPPALQGFFNQGRQAGLSDAETASILKYGTNSAIFKQRQLDMQQARLEYTLDKQNKGVNLAGTIQAVGNAGQQLALSGVKPGTLEYAMGIAAATSNSQTGLTSSETGGYQSAASIMDRIGSLKDDLAAIDKDNQAANILLSYSGDAVRSIASKDLSLLTAKINSIAAPIARLMYGEKGTLTEGDVSRVLSSMPTGLKTKDVRDALFTGLVTYASNSLINRLSIDASTGRNVSGVAPFVQQSILSARDAVSSMNQNFTITVGGKTYTFKDQTGLNSFKKEAGIK